MPEISKNAAPLLEGEGKVPLTVVRPDGSVRGGILLLHQSHAFSAAMLQFMEALAEERWIVVAPDLHHRDSDTDTSELFGESLYADADATLEWITSGGIASDTVGVIGFDDAGAAALFVAAGRPVGAVVSVSSPGITRPLRSSLPPLVDVVRSLRAPWLGLYGVDDPKTPPADIESLRDAAGESDAPTLVVSYEGLAHRPDEPPVEHASADPDTDPQEAAIVDARRRIFDWFDSHLR
ncbi:dienelactone hydrolase family protein [Rhodococcus chondri]|uniref:Dienelactone hydrolase family protein n=1 Tax=Rhodococcus chondri TaxID=3065941 RepID=A0ABU7JNY6_9NOCA|nr:dienelactone hydrolase family protein [Rhodococcus sp. CC-R104]MEE2031184.1 dienelactone hydrolase family protein [Rhodococcus sp. CC-R104]